MKENPPCCLIGNFSVLTLFLKKKKRQRSQKDKNPS